MKYKYYQILHSDSQGMFSGEITYVALPYKRKIGEHLKEKEAAIRITEGFFNQQRDNAKMVISA